MKMRRRSLRQSAAQPRPAANPASAQSRSVIVLLGLVHKRYGTSNGIKCRIKFAYPLANHLIQLLRHREPTSLTFRSSYESSVAEAFGNLLSSPAYLSPAFLKDEPSSMNFRC